MLAFCSVHKWWTKLPAWAGSIWYLSHWFLHGLGDNSRGKGKLIELRMHQIFPPADACVQWWNKSGQGWAAAAKGLHPLTKFSSSCYWAQLLQKQISLNGSHNYIPKTNGSQEHVTYFGTAPLPWSQPNLPGIELLQQSKDFGQWSLKQREFLKTAKASGSFACSMLEGMGDECHKTLPMKDDNSAAVTHTPSAFPAPKHTGAQSLTTKMLRKNIFALHPCNFPQQKEDAAHTQRTCWTKTETSYLEQPPQNISRSICTGSPLTYGAGKRPFGG